MTLATGGQEEDMLSRLVERYSSWTRLKRAIAWLLKFRRSLPGKKKVAVKKLTVQEIEDAEKAIIKYVQGQEYRSEIETLKNGGRLKKGSKVYKLDRELADGVLVCGTRQRKTREGEMKRMLILPKDHHVSDLVVKHHEEAGHSGREHTVNDVRQAYWIIGIRTLVQRLIGKCQRCRRLFSIPMKQRMAGLPKERLATDEPPFSTVGLDCFGPFVTKVGRRQCKRYGCIFTCLMMRAVHLEVLDSMDTSSFINEMQRFICHRGQPKTIVSDNGTNFVGEEQELSESIDGLDQEKIESFLSRRHIRWKWNPPAASHMGRVWECLIRSVRRVLNGVMEQQTIIDDTLSTLMCLVENILNSRPLTVVPDDPGDLAPLTPNHLLQMRPSPLPPPGLFDCKDCYVRRQWRQVQYMADVFWRRWIREYLPLVQLRTKW